MEADGFGPTEMSIHPTVRFFLPSNISRTRSAASADHARRRRLRSGKQRTVILSCDRENLAEVGNTIRVRSKNSVPAGANRIAVLLMRHPGAMRRLHRDQHRHRIEGAVRLKNGSSPLPLRAERVNAPH